MGLSSKFTKGTMLPAVWIGSLSQLKMNPFLVCQAVENSPKKQVFPQSKHCKNNVIVNLNNSAKLGLFLYSSSSLNLKNGGTFLLWPFADTGHFFVICGNYQGIESKSNFEHILMAIFF